MYILFMAHTVCLIPNVNELSWALCLIISVKHDIVDTFTARQGHCLSVTFYNHNFIIKSYFIMDNQIMLMVVIVESKMHLKMTKTLLLQEKEMNNSVIMDVVANGYRKSCYLWLIGI